VHRTRLIRLSAFTAFSLLAGCDLRVTAPPRYQAQVINLRNDLAVEVTGLEDVTEDLQYTWVNDGTAANVVQAPTDLTGTASLFIRDGAGIQVYQRSLAENGTFATTSGVPGTWTVRVHFSEANGAVTLRVKSP
jgi:hypothetical protein